MFNGIKNGLNTVGQDLSYGAQLIKDQPRIQQQYNQLVAPQAAQLKAKKQALATKMPKPQANPTPNYMDTLRSNIASNLTSPGRDSKYLQ